MLFTMIEFVESFEIAIACSGKIKAEIKIGQLLGSRTVPNRFLQPEIDGSVSAVWATRGETTNHK